MASPKATLHSALASLPEGGGARQRDGRSPALCTHLMRSTITSADSVGFL